MGSFFENIKEEKEIKKEDVIKEDISIEETNENENYSSTETTSMKKKNNITFAVCMALIGCIATLIGVFIGSNFGSNNATNILVSDSGNNRTELISVNNTEKALSASEIYANNVNSIAYIKTEISRSNLFGQIIKGESAGSGFIVSEDGYVITNYHVVDEASSIKVYMANNKEYEAKLIGFEEENDIAVLKIDSTDVFVPVILGDSDKTIVGEDVVAIGNPLGELTFSLTKGVVSGFDREILLSHNNQSKSGLAHPFGRH